MYECYDLICGCEFTLIKSEDDTEVYHCRCNSKDCCCSTREQLQQVFAHPNFFIISNDQYWH